MIIQFPVFTVLHLPVCLGLLDRLDLFILSEKKVVWCFILVISFYLWSVVHTFSTLFKGEILVATSREQLRLWSCTQWPQMFIVLVIWLQMDFKSQIREASFTVGSWHYILVLILQYKLLLLFACFRKYRRSTSGVTKLVKFSAITVFGWV